MNIGVLKVENAYEWMMFVYAILRIIANSLVASYMIHLFVKNLREQFVDIIKLLQTTFVFVWFFSDVLTILISIFNNSLLSNPIVTVFVLITDPYMFCYGLNQFAWLVLILHLSTYQMMIEGKSYSECRNIIKRSEFKLFILMTIMLTLLLLVQILLYTLKTTKVIDQDFAKMIINIEGLIITFSFTLSECILYIKVTSTLEKCLHSYYIENKNYLKYRMLLNVWYFSIFSMLFIVNLLTPSTVNLMVTFDISPPYDNAVNIVYIFGILLTDIPSIIYACINAKHIKFKEWIIVVMEGHRILKQFNGCSIFIKNLKCFKKEISQIDVPDENNEPSNSESFSADFTKDYNEDSEYQRNYKQKFILNKKVNE